MPYDRPPNILFFLPDQHRHDWLGTNTALPVRTPNIDRLARNGTTFAHAYCPSPLCAPSRACLAAGIDYRRSPVRNNGQDLPRATPTYYRLLQDAGYHVLGCGKFDLHKATLDWNLDGSRCLEEWGFTDGIDNEGKFDGSRSYRDAGGPKGPYLRFLHERGKAETYVAEHENVGAARGAYTTALSEQEYCDNWVAENGLSLLARVPQGDPWHLVVNFTGPHNPMDVTPRMRRRWEGVRFPEPHGNDQPNYSPEDHQRNRQNYAAMIEHIDRHVGRFLEVVAQRGELERTVVVYSSDHGEMLGDHGLWGKSTWRDPSVRVPLIAGVPGMASGGVSDALVSLYDLAATFLQLAGVAIPASMDAKPLVPVLQGRTDRHRSVIVSGLDRGGRGSWRMAYDGRYKYVRTTETPADGPSVVEELLYDTRVDPWEDRNIISEHPTTADALRRAVPGEHHE
jgi:arylsulfatase A-like enzyme